MSMKMKHSVFHLALWVIVGILFLSIFLAGKTIENWGDNQTKTLMLAVLFGVGFLGEAILRYIYRDREGIIIKDERDSVILSKALSKSFVGTIIYVYLIAVVLYIVFESVGSVPVAWLWFIAYSLILVANITTSAFSMYYYRKSE